MTQSGGLHAEYEAGLSSTVLTMGRSQDLKGLHQPANSAKQSKVGSSRGCLTLSVVSLESNAALQDSVCVCVCVCVCVSCSVVSDSLRPPETPVMEFSRQDYWSGLPFPSLGDLRNSRVEPRSPTLQADSFTVWATREILQDTRGSQMF